MPIRTGLLVANLGACLLAVGMVAVGPGPGGTLAVLAADGTDAAVLVARAGARIVSTSPNGRFAVASSERPDLRARLSASGAVLVFNPLLALGCRSPGAGS